MKKTFLFAVLISPCLTIAGESIVRSGPLLISAAQHDRVVRLVLADKEIEYAKGPAVYEIETGEGQRLSLEPRLTAATPEGISILAGSPGIEVSHEITALASGDGFIERIEVRNNSGSLLRISDYCFALQRAATAQGQLRAVAVPFRRQADGRLRDWTLDEIAAGKAANSDWRNDAAVIPPEIIDSARGRLRSEGWILANGHTGLLVAKHNNENIEYSMLSWHGGSNPALRLGGSSFALHREPEPMQQLAPGQSVKLGATYYLAVSGGWPAGYERFRRLLNGLGHGLPANYDPPINWNELFDIGWYHSDHAALSRHYTKDALLGEAAKAAQVGATALYLDPGWEVCEGTTLWDRARLGSVSDMVRTLRDRSGLFLAFRTIGRVYRDEFSHNWYVHHSPSTQPSGAAEYSRPCANPAPSCEPVPASDSHGIRNLALLPGAKARASSCLPGYAIHQIAHLNDGWYGNSASWISGGDPSWAEIDLGAVYRINRMRLGSEHSPWYRDRAPVHVRVLAATEYAEDSHAPQWQTVAENKGGPIATTRDFGFAPREARWVRVEILSSTSGGNARIDEIEVYEAAPQPWPVQPRRRALATTTAPCDPIAFWEVCTQCPEWQREKAARIERVASQGMVFAMFDEFDWRGPCYSKDHGHPVPSTPQGHVAAVYGLIREVKKRVPGLLVEAHDPVWPWGVRYLPIYFDYPRSYDENWGFEFMWNPIEDLISGRALCLYYYNFACEIPLYDHITAEKDNDACLAFWWYASTVRHLGIGGKKGLDSKQENTSRWAAYRAAMAQYRRLREWFVRGRFIGIDELAHLHVLPGRCGGVLVAFNLGDQPVDRKIALRPADAGLRPDGPLPVVEPARAAWHEGQLQLTFTIPPRSPRVIEIVP